MKTKETWTRREVVALVEAVEWLATHPRDPDDGFHADSGVWVRGDGGMALDVLHEVSFPRKAP
jgi:hypothetical protein